MELLTKPQAYRMNITQVRLVGEGQNEFVPVLEAFRRAEDMGLDLILVSETSNPPVVRIQDFKKLEYEKKKAKKASKVAVSVLKEVQFKVNISEHDLATKVQKIDSFLKRGDKVKISVRLKGREKENPERAYQLLQKIAGSVECRYSPVGGPMAMAILEPAKTHSAASSPPVSSPSQRI